nr:reverse transcriptase domain-containing protein [Tanacetum cinerariifolium]
MIVGNVWNDFRQKRVQKNDVGKALVHMGLYGNDLVLVRYRSYSEDEGATVEGPPRKTTRCADKADLRRKLMPKFADAGENSVLRVRVMRQNKKVQKEEKTKPGRIFQGYTLLLRHKHFLQTETLKRKNGPPKKPTRVWLDKLRPVSINRYEMLRKAFLGNFSQQKKYIKDPVEIHHIKQREWESTEAFMERFKVECIHESPIVIEAEVEGHLVHHMYMDEGSASEIIYEHYFNRLRLKVKSQMVPATTPLQGFSGEISWPLGQISLMVSIGEGEHFMNSLMNFMVVKSPSSYNGIVTLCGNTIIPVEFRMVVEAPNRSPPKEPMVVKGIKPVDMTGVQRSIAEHRLNILKGCQAIRQKRIGQALDMNKAIQEEVTKIVEAEIIKEVHYHDWLLNPVMAHPIVVVTDQSIKQILSQRKNTRRMLKLRFKLEAFDNTYKPKTSIRDQFLANFIAERPDEEGSPTETQAKEITLEPWTLFTDGSSCLEGSGAGLILTSLEGEEFTYPLRFKFDASNNEAEYEALVVGPRITEKMAREAAHPIVVVTDQSIKQILSRRKNIRRMLKLRFELEAFDNTYKPKTSIRDQFLADFIAERPDEEGAGLILTSPEGKEFTYPLRFKFYASNNEAEYEALVVGPRITEKMGIENL